MMVAKRINYLLKRIIRVTKRFNERKNEELGKPNGVKL